MDGLWEVGEGQDKVFLHFEPQGYHDPSFPVRMLRYRADFWEGTLSTGKGAPPLYQVALFYLPKDENKENSLVDKWDKGEGISYKYRVIRAWEMDKGPVLQKELLALYPLLPLMREEPGETPERVMEVITQAIKGVEDPSLKADLFAAVSVFAEMRYTSELVKKFIGRNLFMESQLVKEWTAEAVKEAVKEVEKRAAEERKEAEKRAAEERKEAAKEAETRTAYITLQFNTLELLEAKFASVPEKVKDRLLKIQDVDKLKALFKNAIKVETLEAFEDYLEKF